MSIFFQRKRICLFADAGFINWIETIFLPQEVHEKALEWVVKRALATTIYAHGFNEACSGVLRQL